MQGAGERTKETYRALAVNTIQWGEKKKKGSPEERATEEEQRGVGIIRGRHIQDTHHGLPENK